MGLRAEELNWAQTALHREVNLGACAMHKALGLSPSNNILENKRIKPNNSRPVLLDALQKSTVFLSVLGTEPRTLPTQSKQSTARLQPWCTSATNLTLTDLSSSCSITVWKWVFIVYALSTVFSHLVICLIGTLWCLKTSFLFKVQSRLNFQ